jgi:sphingomyelin phosphodiesterase acid-like 3
MIGTSSAKRPGGIAHLGLIVLCLVLAIAQCFAQSGAARGESGERSVTALFVSDIHFEPFWDPEKTVQLAVAPAAEWRAIFAAPDSVGREARFASVEKACPTRGEDTTYKLFASSLRAMHSDAANAKFVTVSGDLIAHSFPCKFRAVFPSATPEDQRAFAEKTIEFVMDSLRKALPGVPVYAALGNNDSDCGDYQLDANGAFLARAGKVAAADVSEEDRRQSESDFAAGGYMSVPLPAPLKDTRLLVLDDIFMSRRYQTCGGKTDSAPAGEQITWLEQQLSDARRNKEKIWVMAHIPPGVDPYSTATKGANICAGKEPTMFLSSEALPQTLAKYGDVIRLVIFAHTHMDELRLLEPEKQGTVESGVAVKMVASISPVNGNNPSFTVAAIDPESATLKDYRVFVASNQTGVNTKWTEEYDFDKAYNTNEFSATSLRSLIAEFAADSSAQSAMSRNYIRSYGSGETRPELEAFWPLYVCSLQHDAGDALAACACAAIGSTIK